MKIAIDISPAEKDPDGIGQYTINLLNALFDIDKTNEYILYSTSPYKTDKQNIVIKRSKILPFKGMQWMMEVANHAKKNKVDMLISPSNHLFPMLFKKVISFVYDLTPVFFPQFYSKKGSMVYKYGLKHFIPKSYKVVTISETVKNDIVEFTKIPEDKIIVVYPSINEKILDNAVDFVDFGLPSKYLVSISTLSPKKNIPALLEGFKNYLISSGDIDTKLVIIGRKGWKYNEVFSKLKQLDLEKDVTFLGYVADKFVASILKRASGLIALNTHEGFGMPILEALYFDLPVIANDIPVFRECFGESITYVDAKKPEEVGKAIKVIINDPEKLNFDKERYNWQKSAKALLEIIN